MDTNRLHLLQEKSLPRRSRRLQRQLGLVLWLGLALILVLSTLR
jgi:hypothetical protein